MKINEIIREKRVAKGLTQEQVGSYLGVSTSAVNKWEKGISYPDITLLPALARLLDTDLNTLLDFEEDLSQQEVGNFLNELYSVATTKGIDQAFNLSMDKIHQYPSCDILLLNVALTLEGFISMHCENDANQDYLKTIENLYLRVAEGKDPQAQNQAKAILVSKYMKRNELNKAENLLNELPDKILIDKKQLQANLYIAQGKLEKASSIIEMKILSELSSVQTSLFTLMDIALKENRTSDAEGIAYVAREMVGLFDLWEYSSYIADFQLTLNQKDATKCHEVLEKMLPAMLKKWDITKSPLYKHIPEKENNQNLGELMLPKIISDFENLDNHEYDFLRENIKTKKLIEKLKLKANIK